MIFVGFSFVAFLRTDIHDEVDPKKCKPTEKNILSSSPNKFLSGEWEAGNGKWEVGSGEWEVGSGKWEVGSGKWGVGSEE